MQVSNSSISARMGEEDAVSVRRRQWLSPGELIVFCSLTVVGLLAYTPFYAPALFMDDWTSVIERVSSGNASWLDLTYRRPLLFIPFLAQYNAFGINLTAYYAILLLSYVLLAFLLYRIIVRLPLIHRRTFGFVTAALFLVYPTNYTHMWLIMLGVHCALALTLAYAYLLLRYAEGGHWFLLVLAISCLLVSLGIYEAQLGVASAWAVFVFFLYRRTAYGHRLGVLTPILVAGLFAAWRTFGYQGGGIADRYLEQMDFTPQTLLSRVLLGYKITMGWGWTHSLQELLPWITSTKIALLFQICLVALAVAVVFWVTARSGNRHAARNFSLRRITVKQYGMTAVAGLLLMGAGYVPVALVFLPSLGDIGSRFNIVATIGGAVTLPAVMMMAAGLLGTTAQQRRYLFLAATVPFIVLGIVTQAAVQRSNRIAWHEQQAIWRALFIIAPDFADDTFVLMVLPGYQERMGFETWRRTPLSSSWEVSSGLRLLYDNSTLAGDVVFPDADSPIEAVLQTDGVLTREHNSVTPYGRVVAYQFDPEASALVQLVELPAQLADGTDKLPELCTDCVRFDAAPDVSARSLVQPRAQGLGLTWGD